MLVFSFYILLDRDRTCEFFDFPIDQGHVRLLSTRKEQ